MIPLHHHQRGIQFSKNYFLFNSIKASDADTPSDDDHSLLGAKIGTLLGLFILSLVLGLLPYIVHHLSKIERLRKLKKTLNIIQLIFMYCNCVAAGAILGSGLTHLLPDSVESFNNYFEIYNNQTSSEVEVSSFSSSSSSFLNHYSGIKAFVLGFDSSSSSNNSTFTPIPETITEYPWAMMIAGTICLFLVGLDRVFSEHSHGSSQSYEGTHSHHHHHEENNSVQVGSSGMDETSTLIHHHHSSITTSSEKNEFIAELVLEEQKAQRKYSFLVKSLLFTFAICVHSVFEAFALGLESDMSSFVSLFIPIVAHKGFESLTTGFIVLRYTLCRKAFQIWILVQVAIYAISTPVGMGIGMAISSDLSLSYYMIAGIIQSIACGSFLFIACFEIIPSSLEESSTIKGRLFKMFLVVLGFAVMCILAAFS